MNANAYPKTMYYKAKEELQINNLPFFFGRIEIRNGKITGKHYKPKFDRLTETYLLGYYRIKGEAADFWQIFQTHGDAEITEEEFSSLLGQWDQGKRYPPVSWGLGEVIEVVSPSWTDN